LRYSLDWEVIELEGDVPLHLLDPFDADPVEVEMWCRSHGLEGEEAPNRKSAGPG